MNTIRCGKCELLGELAPCDECNSMQINADFLAGPEPKDISTLETENAALKEIKAELLSALVLTRKQLSEYVNSAGQSAEKEDRTAIKKADAAIKKASE